MCKRQRVTFHSWSCCIIKKSTRILACSSHSRVFHCQMFQLQKNKIYRGYTPRLFFFFSFLFTRWIMNQSWTRVHKLNSARLASCLLRHWVRSGLSPAKWLFSHTSALHRTLDMQVPISPQWSLPAPMMDTIWDITNLLGVTSIRVPPPPCFPLPFQLFTTASPHADHSSEVVTVGGVLGGVCVFVLRVWMCVWLCGWGSVCVSGKNTGRMVAHDAFASASEEEVSAALFTVGEPEIISVIRVIDTVSHSGEGRGRHSGGLKGKNCTAGHLQADSYKPYQLHLNTGPGFGFLNSISWG